MLETAIVGGGLCGLALARGLRARGHDVMLFEARERLGGRIVSAALGRPGAAVDLGATWFWPDTQPLIHRLLADLGLASFPQHDEGDVLYLGDPDKAADVVVDESVHAGARRIEGGMARLIDALAASLPSERLRYAHELTSVEDRGDHVVLSFTARGAIVEVRARAVVLAIPPRLLDEHVRFYPPLEAALVSAMREAPTWMAEAAKVVIGYDNATWRAAGRSGSAFVTHEQAVIGEIFDACGPSGRAPALGGFLALSPPQRADFSVGLSLLMESQMIQVFGTSVGDGEQHYCDWSLERFTCARLDLEKPRADHAGFANPMLREALWSGKLYLGATETASQGAGYAEGAIDAARRLEQGLARGRPRAKAEIGGGASGMTAFQDWVGRQRQHAFETYRRRLHRGLSSNQRDQLTQRAVLGAVEEVFGNALEMLADMTFEAASLRAERGRCKMTPEIQAPFGDFLKGLMEDVIAFNRASCALSNFPDEHRLSTAYEQVILRDIAAAWREFSLSANRLLLAKADPPGAAPSSVSTNQMRESLHG